MSERARRSSADLAIVVATLALAGTASWSGRVAAQTPGIVAIRGLNTPAIGGVVNDIGMCPAAAALAALSPGNPDQQ